MSLTLHGVVFATILFVIRFSRCDKNDKYSKAIEASIDIGNDFRVKEKKLFTSLRI